MKTANELADLLEDSETHAVDSAVPYECFEAAAMLRSQAIAIDALTALTESLKIQRDALATDARRWVFWRSLFDVDSKVEANVVHRIEQAVSMKELDSAVDAAIDAMKGKS